MPWVRCVAVILLLALLPAEGSNSISRTHQGNATQPAATAGGVTETPGLISRINTAKDAVNLITPQSLKHPDALAAKLTDDAEKRSQQQAATPAPAPHKDSGVEKAEVKALAAKMTLDAEATAGKQSHPSTKPAATPSAPTALAPTEPAPMTKDHPVVKEKAHKMALEMRHHSTLRRRATATAKTMAHKMAADMKHSVSARRRAMAASAKIMHGLAKQHDLQAKEKVVKTQIKALKTPAEREAAKLLKTVTAATKKAVKNVTPAGPPTPTFLHDQSAKPPAPDYFPPDDGGKPTQPAPAFTPDDGRSPPEQPPQHQYFSSSASGPDQNPPNANPPPVADAAPTSEKPNARNPAARGTSYIERTVFESPLSILMSLSILVACCSGVCIIMCFWHNGDNATYQVVPSKDPEEWADNRWSDTGGQRH